jgi:cytochrome P450
VTIRAARKHKNLEQWRDMLAELSTDTAEGRIAGRRILFTADPENIKAILATQFGDYGKGEPFHREWKAFLGDSIFTTDGHLWHDSRQLIRPQFIKDRVSDLHVFESHMQTLFRAIANGGALDGENQPVDIEAGNGKPVDISDLFFRYTLDSATDFLLGYDVKSLRFAIPPSSQNILMLTTPPATPARNSPTPLPRSSASRASSRARAPSTSSSRAAASTRA